jgi:type VI protein secretion system component VasF
MNAYDEERIAELLRGLPPAPQAWVKAAQELPLVRGRLDEIVARAEEDARFRERLLADLEQALAAEGYEPDPTIVEALRERFREE